MLAGFVDGRGRAYDVGFRTLRLSLTDEEGVLLTEAGEKARVQGRATVSVDLLDSKAIPLLLPVAGDLTATERRVVFLAAAGVPRKEPFTFFNVSLGLHPTAIEHFFTVQGGREFLQFTKEDVESSSPAGGATVVVLRGSRPGKPAEAARYRARIEPRTFAERALAALG
jgi:hypothetical protein